MTKLDLRSDEMMAEYREHLSKNSLTIGCPLCNKPSLVEFKHWRIVASRFPYDRIASVHHMLISKIHSYESELPTDAQVELVNLKSTHLNDNYDIVIEALPHRRSIPTHQHYHLIVQKEI